ncbi:excisionase family DNA-binding protein [Nocardia niigatensis]
MRTTHSPIKENSTGAAHRRLPADTQAILRALGGVAIQLADNQDPEVGWLRAQLSSLPGNFTHARVEPSVLLTIPEVCSRLRLSRWSVYQLIHRNELASVKVGRRRFIPATEADRFLSELIDRGGQR